ncbi:MAG: hypothetical protein J6W46_05595, partial [Spirochaetaceae bacterium]|nr:hypothetical protein [Spirochaetaceae bacterium]
KPLTSFYIDTLAGDERRFDLLLPVYYGNIRQGEIAVSFTIDKLPPKAPVLSIEDDAISGNNAVAVSVFSTDDVYTAIDTRTTVWISASLFRLLPMMPSLMTILCSCLLQVQNLFWAAARTIRFIRFMLIHEILPETKARR